jgi:hypothetical protein
MERIVKGKLKDFESWVERIHFSKKIANGTKFTDKDKHKWTLCGWTPIDGHMLLSINNNVVLPSELTLTSNDTSLTLTELQDITDILSGTDREQINDTAVQYINIKALS